MTAMTMNHDLNSADGFPLSLGRGTGMTIKEFNRKLNAFMRKKNMPKLTFGCGPARVPNTDVHSPQSAVQSPKPKVHSPKAKVWDVWGML